MPYFLLKDYNEITIYRLLDLHLNLNSEFIFLYLYLASKQTIFYKLQMKANKITCNL